MLAVSMPKEETAAALVEMATKCDAMAAGSGSLAWSQARAVPALSMVSCVVKVLEHTSSSVVSGSSPLSVSVTCVPSTCAAVLAGIRRPRAERKGQRPTYVADKVHFEHGAVVLEGLGDHNRPKIRAANTNVHDVGKALAGEPETQVQKPELIIV
jgi:hypothetical protein